MQYTRKKFGWTEKDYTLYSSVDTVHDFCRSIVVLPVLSSCLRVHDAVIGMTGAISWINYYLVVALVRKSSKKSCSFLFNFNPTQATQGWMMYYATFVATIGGLTSTPIYGLITKCVDADELGKLFTVTSLVEGLMSLFSNVLFSTVYSDTVGSDPSLIWFVMAGITGIVVVGFVGLFALTLEHERVHGTLTTEDEDLKKILD